MTNSKRHAKSPNKTLDRVGEKRRRGRDRKVQPDWVVGRAYNFGLILEQVWEQLWPLLSSAQNESDVTAAFEQGATVYARQFVPHMSGLVLQIVRERRFPKRRSARIGFMADSLGGMGDVSPRRSRDICSEARAAEEKAKQAHRIIRYEFYIECSCGFKGPSLNHACRRCGAKIIFGSSIASLSPFLAGADSVLGTSE